MKLTTESRIRDRLVAGDNLVKSQVEYVKRNIEPKYDNFCSVCRVNVLLYFGFDFMQASDFANASYLGDNAAYLNRDLDNPKVCRKHTDKL